jgi:hypothetical protein
MSDWVSFQHLPDKVQCLMIKAIITTDSVTYISRHDPGLDAASCDFDAYFREFDEKHLAIKPGEAVTRWTIRPCSQTEVRRALGVATVDGGGMALLPDVGAKLLEVGLIAATDMDKEGDKVEWPRGVPVAVLNKIPAIVQIDLAQTIYAVSNGHGAGGLEDEGKPPSPSSSKGQGNSTKLASSAPTAAKTKANAGGGGARSLRKSKS